MKNRAWNYYAYNTIRKMFYAFREAVSVPIHVYQNADVASNSAILKIILNTGVSIPNAASQGLRRVEKLDE